VSAIATAYVELPSDITHIQAIDSSRAADVSTMTKFPTNDAPEMTGVATKSNGIVASTVPDFLIMRKDADMVPRRDTSGERQAAVESDRVRASVDNSNMPVP
jgi:hypothetical protein